MKNAKVFLLTLFNFFTGQVSKTVGSEFISELIEGTLPLVRDDVVLTKEQQDRLDGVIQGIGFAYSTQGVTMKDRLTLEIATYINSCRP
jgi:hypothetical protein